MFVLFVQVCFQVWNKLLILLDLYVTSGVQHILCCGPALSLPSKLVDLGSNLGRTSIRRVLKNAFTLTSVNGKTFDRLSTSQQRASERSKRCFSLGISKLCGTEIARRNGHGCSQLQCFRAFYFVKKWLWVLQENCMRSKYCNNVRLFVFEWYPNYQI